MRKPATILDVAEAARVSKSTVSNVVRGTGHVSPETRRRVLEAIAALSYRPNVLARNLVQRRTSTIGLVVGDLSNPFYSELARLVEREASSAGYTTMISNTDGRADREQRRIESLLEHRVAGVLMLQFSGERAVVGELLAQGVPLVVLTCWDDQVDCICADDRLAAATATRHLLDLGHRRVGYVSSGLVEPATERVRFDGYRQALEEVGEAVPDQLVLRLREPAYLRSDRGMRRELERVFALREAPTAFFCTNDLVAINLIETLEELGLSVPADVSVAGFDDIAVAGLGRVSLTTIAQPRGELARLGVEQLLARIERGTGPPLRQVRLEAPLVVRSSTGPPHEGHKA